MSLLSGLNLSEKLATSSGKSCELRIGVEVIVTLIDFASRSSGDGDDNGGSMSTADFKSSRLACV